MSIVALSSVMELTVQETLVGLMSLVGIVEMVVLMAQVGFCGTVDLVALVGLVVPVGLEIFDLDENHNIGGFYVLDSLMF